MVLNPYVKNPYQGGEYNINGDSANGRAGSYTPEAIQNRAAQPVAQKSGNPYAAILEMLPQAATTMRRKQGPMPGRSPQTATTMDAAMPPQSFMPPGSAQLPVRYGPDGKPLPFAGDPNYYGGGFDPTSHPPVGTVDQGIYRVPSGGLRPAGPLPGGASDWSNTYYNPQNNTNLAHGSGGSSVYDPMSGNYVLALSGADRGEGGTGGLGGDGGPIDRGDRGGGGVVTDPNNPLPGGHTPNTPGMPPDPNTPVPTPGRGRGVRDRGLTPTPNPSPNNEKPVDWEEINATVQRWRQGAIDKGRPDIAEQVTPQMIRLYRGNEMGLDPISWLEKGGTGLVQRWTAANPQGGNVPQGLTSFDQYDPHTTQSGPTTHIRGGGSPWTGTVVPNTGTPPTPPPTGPVIGPPPPPGMGDPIGDAGKGNIDPATGLPLTGGGNGQPQPPPGADTGSYKSVIDQIHNLFAPGNRQAQNELARQLNAEAALTGGINAGGYLGGPNSKGVFGGAMSDLVNKQGAQEANFLQQANESALQRGVDVYGIQAKMFGDQLAADVQRYGIKTNADLQQQLQNGQLAYQYKALDKNDLLERYKSELALKGQQYSADREVDAAALHAAAAQAAAAASSQAALQEAQLRYALGLKQLDLDTTKMQNDYNLDLGKLDLSRYMFDTPNINTLLQIYSQFSPEFLTNAGLGNGFPGFIFNPNTQFDWTKLFGSNP